MKIGLILSSPSPHQVELIDAIAAHPQVDAFVGYVNSHNPARHWGRPVTAAEWENLPTSATDILSGRLHGWFRERQADVWLLSSVYTSPATHVIARLLRRRGDAFAFLGEPPQPRTGWRGAVQTALMKPVISRASGIIGTGRESARRYQSLSQSKVPVTSVPYCVDFSAQLQGTPLTPPAAHEPYRFVASSQLIHRKGIDVLLQACQLLPEGGWTLDIYGDGPLKSVLQEQSAGMSDRITFHGLLPYDQRQQVFAGKHCFVFSTRWDGWGMVLPEALAMGLPVVTTDQAMSAHDFITDGENGQIVPAADPERLASAMRQAMDSRQQLRQQSIAARDSLREYSPHSGARQLVAFLARVARPAA